jgi:very-short-patch-repair endonuclease
MNHIIGVSMASLKHITLQKKAAELRASPTNAESRLWLELRNRKLGVKFRRQHVVGDFIIDFYCVARKLAVELDGSVHRQATNYDRWRDKMLRDEGIVTLRFSNEQVFCAMEHVLEEILEHLEGV